MTRPYRQSNTQHRQRYTGWTLSELLISLALMSVLAALALLTAAQQAQSARSFEGVVVFMHDGRFDAVRVVHRPGEAGYQQIASLSGMPRALSHTGRAGSTAAIRPAIGYRGWCWCRPASRGRRRWSTGPSAGPPARAARRRAARARSAAWSRSRRTRAP